MELRHKLRKTKLPVDLAVRFNALQLIIIVQEGAGVIGVDQKESSTIRSRTFSSQNNLSSRSIIIEVYFQFQYSWVDKINTESTSIKDIPFQQHLPFYFIVRNQYNKLEKVEPMSLVETILSAFQGLDNLIFSFKIFNYI